MAEPGEVTQLLLDWSSGNKEAIDKLVPIVYKELRRLAANRLKAERSDHTLEATGLVHEAYLKLINWKDISWQNRAHFFSVAAHQMREILVDHARSRRAAKRGGKDGKLLLNVVSGTQKGEEVDLIVLDEALKRLAALDPQQSRIIELKFFAGMTIEETAEVLKISAATVKREWTLAKAWLLREIKSGEGRRG